jgi:cytidylate kinase
MTLPMHNLARYTEAVERAQNHWQTRQEQARAGQTHAYTIALARQAGAPGTSVGQEVGRRLGWQVYDHELLEHIAREMGLRVNLLESVDERRRSWLLECLETFATGPSVAASSFVRHLVETVLSLGSHGHCVIVGRGAVQLLPPETTLRVRLVGDLQDRIAAAGARMDLPRDEAARWVETTDRERARFARDHWHVDINEPTLYDLVLNTSRWSVVECADLIVAALRKLEERDRARGALPV